jgi:hypothetical protein
MESQGMSGKPSPIPTNTPLRYVILHHTGHGEPHYDLMLQIAQSHPLSTWRILRPPTEWHEKTPATRLPDHRDAYLTYEGPVSNNRGSVKRIADGIAKVIELQDDSLTLVLDNPTITLRLPLTPD